MEYISRAIEELTRKTRKTFKVVLVTGARQTGKSTMLRHLFPDLRYVQLDDEMLLDQINESPHLFMDINPSPIIIDEIQKAPILFPLVKIECDKSDKKGLFCLSGSQPLSLMKNVSESLAGRVGIIEMTGLSLRELTNDTFNEPFLPSLEQIRRHSRTINPHKSIWDVIHRGSYPELQNDDVDWNMFYSSYVSTYIYKDVRELSAVQNPSDFRKFMIACAARTGRMLNNTSIANDIGIDSKTARNWMSILEASGIVYLLEPFEHNLLKRTVRTPKLYFRDTGLAAYLTRWMTPDQLSAGAMAGQIFETFVVSEILKSYSNCGMDYRLFISYYRGKDVREGEGDDEIDLIIEQNGKYYPIEIKKNEKVSEHQAASFRVLDRIPGNKRGTGAIISNAAMPSQIGENLLSIPVWYI